MQDFFKTIAAKQSGEVRTRNLIVKRTVNERLGLRMKNIEGFATNIRQPRLFAYFSAAGKVSATPPAGGGKLL